MTDQVVLQPRRLGRPPSEDRRVAVDLRLDPDVLDAWKATGPGWQTRVNDALRAAVAGRDRVNDEAAATTVVRRRVEATPNTGQSALAR